MTKVIIVWIIYFLIRTTVLIKASSIIMYNFTTLTYTESNKSSFCLKDHVHYLITDIVVKATSVHSRWMFICFVPSSAICWLSEHRAPCCGKWGTPTVTTLNYCYIELRSDKFSTATRYLIYTKRPYVQKLKCINSSTEAFSLWIESNWITCFLSTENVSAYDP